MDHPNQTTMQLPAAYAVITEEEMTYLDGGAEIVLGQAFGYQLTLDTDQFMNFCASLVVNLGYYVLGSSFSYVTGLLQSGIKNGLSIPGTIVHVWSRQETGWSKAAVIGVTGLAGIYAGMQAVSIYRSLKNLYDAIFNPMPTFETAASANTAAA